jgi:hypothetical protein
MRGFLPLAVELWTFGSPGELQIPTFFHVLGFTPTLGQVRVATYDLYFGTLWVCNINLGLTLTFGYSWIKQQCYNFTWHEKITTFHRQVITLATTFHLFFIVVTYVQFDSNIRVLYVFRVFFKIRPKIRRVVKVMQRTITGPQKLYAGFLENPEMPMHQ